MSVQKMRVLQLVVIILCLKSILADKEYTDYIDDISDEDVRIQPSDNTQHNFYKPVPKPTRKPKPIFKTTTEMCMKFLLKRKAAEEAENPSKNYKPSGNRWHGSIGYGRNLFKYSGFGGGGGQKLRDITQVERKSHKCYKWIRTEDLKRYTWPAVMQKSPSENKLLIEFCCPQYGPVRIWGNTVCHPYCSACHNGNCVAPEVCECHDGFVLTENKDCAFTCPISCLNGHCNLFNSRCICNPGFRLDESGLFCKPICRDDCETHALHNCTAPNVCGCIKGYALTDNDCQPTLGVRK